MASDILEGLEDGKQRENEESQSRPVDEFGRGLVNDWAQSASDNGRPLSVEQTIHLLRINLDSQMANRAQVMAAAPAASPSLLAKVYAAAVVSRKTKARKTKALVQMPAWWVCAFTPKASNKESTTKTMVPIAFSTLFCQKLESTYNRGTGRTVDVQTTPLPNSPGFRGSS